MDPILLQQIRDKILGVTGATHGGLDNGIYLQQIRDAILSVTSTVFGSLNEAIYLQQIRNAILGVPDGPFGGLASQIYLQEIRDAYLSVTANPQGGLDEGIYLAEILPIATGGDAVAPTVTITCAQTSPSATTPLNFTFTLSEVSVNFAIGDITVGGVGGTKSNFAGSGSVYTCDIAPTSSGVMTVDVAAGAFTDAAGNVNTAATQFTITVIVFSLRDEFTTDDPAPMVSPRTCEPGPGTLTIVDTSNKFSVSGAKLILNGGVGDRDPEINTGNNTRAAGLAWLVTQLNQTTARIFRGWFSGATRVLAFDTNSDGIMLDGTLLASITPTTQTGGTDQVLSIILRATGGFFVQTVAGVSKLCWIHAATTTTPLVAGIRNFGVGTVHEVDDFRIAQLPSPWDSDYGIATQQLAGARSPGDTFTHEANCFIEFTMTTLPTIGQAEIRFRIQDASNYWQVTVDLLGNLDLDEVVAGTPTQRGTSAAVIANGDRIMILAEGTTIKIYEQNTLRITYASASNFQTATSGKLETEGTGGSVSNIVAWPRTLSGSTLSVLNAMINP